MAALGQVGIQTDTGKEGKQAQTKKHHDCSLGVIIITLKRNSKKKKRGHIVAFVEFLRKLNFGDFVIFVVSEHRKHAVLIGMIRFYRVPGKWNISTQ